MSCATGSLAGRIVLVSVLWVSGCGREPGRDRRQAEVQSGIKLMIAARLADWQTAVEALQQAAPEGDRGWDLVADAPALGDMREAWARGRLAYELVEGLIAPLFPESDVAADSRYETFVTEIGKAGDLDPFDDRGVVGMHAIERILWADAIPSAVIAFEKGLPGYRQPGFPATAAAARAFKGQLVGRLAREIRELSANLGPVELDVAFAFRGLIDLALEQKEKVDKAATGEEESRYAQATMRDLRANTRGCRLTYEIFRPWLLTVLGGSQTDRDVLAAFARLEASYAEVPGDSIPVPPPTWSALAPSAADRVTPFGRLFSAVERESDDETPGSLVAMLGAVANQLELPKGVLR
jgi:iron uptake system component EfeO